MQTEEGICLAMQKIEKLKWKEFDVKDIFPNIIRGRRLKTDDHILGLMPYVSSSAMDNGVDNFISNSHGVRIFNNCITIANSGSVGASFYHPYSFVASDHVTSLTNDKFNKYIYLFIATIASRLSEKYSFNREIKDSRLQREKIMLPVTEMGTPDYSFMEEYMRYTEKKLLTKYKKYLQQTKGKKSQNIGHSKDIKWKEFFIEDVCTIKSGQDIYNRERTKGNNPYVTATALQNGIGYFVGNTNETLESGCLSINRNGSVGYCFYHPYEALFGNDTRKLVPIVKDRYASLFLSAVITKQKDKYGYGLKMGTERLKRQKIMLPVDNNDNPDWKYMSGYMHAKEQDLLLKYIITKDRKVEKNDNKR